MGKHVHSNRDGLGRFAPGKSGRVPPAAPDKPRRNPVDATGVDAASTHEYYEDLWRRNQQSRSLGAYEYAVVTFDESDVVWGTVWASNESEAMSRVQSAYVERGYREGEFSVSGLHLSTDNGFADAQEVYSPILQSRSGRWLLTENPDPDLFPGGGWVAVNALNERLTISRGAGVWHLTEWDPGNGLEAPSTIKLGVFPSAEECLTAAEDRIP